MGIADTIQKFESIKIAKAEKKEKTIWEKRISSFLHKAKRFPEKNRVTSTKDWIGASRLHYLCPRAAVLSYYFPGKVDKWAFGNFLKAEVGTAIHDQVQNAVLGSTQLLYGEWLSDTGERYVGVRPENGTWKYVEPTFSCEQYRWRGRADGVVWIDDVPFKELPLLEIKTTTEENYNSWSTAADLPPYFLTQTECYLQKSGRTQTWFWVFSRNSMSSKIIPYQYDGKYWAVSKQKLCAVWEGVRDKKLPTRPCFFADDPDAKRCTEVTGCFDDNIEALLAKSEIVPPPEILNWRCPDAAQTV